MGNYTTDKGNGAKSMKKQFLLGKWSLQIISSFLNCELFWEFSSHPNFFQFIESTCMTKHFLTEKHNKIPKIIMDMDALKGSRPEKGNYENFRYIPKTVPIS